MKKEKLQKEQHPVLNQVLTPEFLKQFKDSGELNTFMEELYARAMEQMLEGEMDSHLGYEKHSPEGFNSGNSRNGKTSKTVKTTLGEVELEVPRDRNSSFEPVLIPKRSRKVEAIEDIIISLYARGMTVRDIEAQIREVYGYNISDSTISNVTAKVQTLVTEWQNRALSSMYYVVWMDGIVFKVRQNGKVINKTVYLAVGLNSEGHKEMLGMWLGESESASFWMSVMTDLRARGVEDILITSTDNLKGFTEAIVSIFPQSVTQICVVHQIRNASRYVVWKDKKQFAADLKTVYTAASKDLAWDALEVLEVTWGKKYPHAIKSWKSNWTDLSHFFDFPLEIRTMIYTTNIIENLNGKIRKYTKAKMSFPDDASVLKSVFLALREITRKWTFPVRNWSLIVNQFINIFGERCKL
ncbi:MAG TPA: IS256 family transposase [Chryseolinea sp.]|nr:IS256 family transposase [Chryseolinea sp.]